MKALALFAVASAALIVASGWALQVLLRGDAAMQAIEVSAVVAFVVQLFGFAVARFSATGNVMIGWGLGVLLRFLILAVYALAIVRGFGLAVEPALISLASFFFLSTLIEPVLLRV